MSTENAGQHQSLQQVDQQQQRHGLPHSTSASEQLQSSPGQIGKEKPASVSNSRLLRRGSFDHLSTRLATGDGERVGRRALDFSQRSTRTASLSTSGHVSDEHEGLATLLPSMYQQALPISKSKLPRISRATSGSVVTAVPTANFGTKLRKPASAGKSTRTSSPGQLRRRGSSNSLTPPNSTTPPSGPVSSGSSSASTSNNSSTNGGYIPSAAVAPGPTASQLSSTSSSSITETSGNCSGSPTSEPSPSPSSIQSQSAAPSPTPPVTAVPAQTTGAPPLFQQKVERVLKARLYLLQQNGPNCFIIGGDFPDHKFKVTIGSQNCSCARANCIHVLFVMVRVLKVNQSSSLLWSKRLHNFEADSLLAKFRSRQARRVDPKKGAERRHSMGAGGAAGVVARRLLQQARSVSMIETAQHGLDDMTLYDDFAVLPAVTGRGDGGTASHRQDDQQGTGSELPDEDAESDDSSPNSSRRGSMGNEQQSGEGVDAQAPAAEGIGDDDSCGSGGIHNEDTIVEEEEEEDVCPICLLEMVDGESMVSCEQGCNNRLHLHCLKVWAEERRRQGERLHCPLCRAEWADSTLGGAIQELVVELIPPEHTQKAEKWAEAFNREVVEALFSRNWEARQSTVRRLQQTFISKMIACRQQANCPPPGRTNPQAAEDIVQQWCVDPETRLWTNPTKLVIESALEICVHFTTDCNIIVYENVLDLMYTIVTYLPVSQGEQLKFVRIKVASVLEVVLLKCAEDSRRKRQRSLDLLRDVCLGEHSRLAIGSALASSQPLPSLGGIDFVLSVATKVGSAQCRNSSSWQFWLGRLRLLDAVLDEDQLGACSLECDVPDPCVHYVRHQLCPFLPSVPVPSLTPAQVEMSLPFKHTLQLVLFAREAMHVPHLGTTRLARRVFLHAGKLALTWGDAARCLIGAVVDTLSASHRGTMTKWLGLVEMGDCDSLHRPYPRQRSRTRPFTVGSPPPFNASGGNSPEQSFYYVPAQLDSDQTPPLPPSVSVMGGPVASVPDATRPRPVTVSSVESSIASSPAPGSAPDSRSSSAPDSRSSTRMSLSRSHSGVAPTTDAHVLERQQQLTPSQVASDDTRRGETHPQLSSQRDTPKLTTDALTLADSASQVVVAASEIVQFAIGDSSDSNDEDGPITHTSSSTSSASPSTFRLREPGEVQDPGNDWDNVLDVEGEDSTDGGGGAGKDPSPGTQASPERSQAHPKLSKSSAVSSDGSMHSSIDRFDSGIDPDPYEKEYCASCAEIVEAETEATTAATEASLYETPLPPLHNLAPPDELVSIHEQPVSGDSPDGGNNIYMEGVHWIKGPKVGSGAFSTVFQARDVAVGTLMCTKQVSFVRNTVPEQARVIHDIQDEVAMLSRLEHPNVIRCLGATKEATHFYIFVEWMPGGSVSDILRRYGAFTDRVVVSYLQQILRGTAYLHDNRVIHRDIKGDNILVDSTGQHVRLSDFGASAHMQATMTGDREFEGDDQGTVAFMAPEVLRGDNYGRSSDIWSIGCTVIEMLSALPPWNAANEPHRYRLIYRIASTALPPDIPAICPPPLRDVCLRCLEMTPAERPKAVDLLKHPVFSSPT